MNDRISGEARGRKSYRISWPEVPQAARESAEGSAGDAPVGAASGFMAIVNRAISEPTLANLAAVVSYIEIYHGRTLAQLFPDETSRVRSGRGDETVQAEAEGVYVDLTLTRRRAGTTTDWSGVLVGLTGSSGASYESPPRDDEPIPWGPDADPDLRGGYYNYPMPEGVSFSLRSGSSVYSDYGTATCTKRPAGGMEINAPTVFSPRARSESGVYDDLDPDLIYIEVLWRYATTRFARYIQHSTHPQYPTYLDLAISGVPMYVGMFQKPLASETGMDDYVYEESRALVLAGGWNTASYDPGVSATDLNGRLYPPDQVRTVTEIYKVPSRVCYFFGYPRIAFDIRGEYLPTRAERGLDPVVSSPRDEWSEEFSNHAAGDYYYVSTVQEISYGQDMGAMLDYRIGPWVTIEPTTVPVYEVGASSVGYPDGKPPDTTPNPPPVPAERITPVGGGCRAQIDGPASCNWTLPKMPETPGIPMPKDFLEDMPVLDVKFPDMPPIGCRLPDFGNLDPCSPNPGTAAPLPGGRSPRGGRQGNNPSVKTGGRTHGARKKTFAKPTTFRAGTSHMAAISQLLMEAGISPVDIIFQIGPEWDKTLRRKKTFAKGAARFDAAMWFARRLMCTIVDEGPPTNNVYVGPPWHRPGQRTWVFDEHYDLFVLGRSYSSEDGDYWAVEVFGAHLSRPVFALTESPFADPENVLRVEVGPDYTRREAELLAAYRAAQLRGASASVQVSVPYNEEYMLRDRMVVRAPDRGVQETFLIFGKESDISVEGYVHVLTGVPPATAAQMEKFPTVLES